MRTSQFTSDEVIGSFTRKKVLSKAELQQQHGCSPMTLWRLLRQIGYLTSYNHNARYYTLATIPRFDDHGLWSYEDIRFSKWGTLPETIVAIIEHSAGGMTAGEVAELLQVRNPKPLLTELALKQRLWRQTMDRSFVYLASEPKRQQQQLRGRNEQALLRLLPEPQQIIALLVEIIRHPQQRPRQWVQNLARRDIRLERQDIRAVMDHYRLSVKKGLLNA
jgi:hypothetical protein